MSSFSVGFHSVGAIEVLTLIGDLDAHTVSELDAAILMCRQNGRHKIVVDGSSLFYISSAGLGAFVGHIDDIREQGGDIKIASLSSKILNVFDLLGLPLLFNIVDTIDEAIALFEPDLPASPKQDVIAMV
ncbi:MAG: STAS domain-containing protein [Rhodothermales bacterium]